MYYKLLYEASETEVELLSRDVDPMFLVDLPNVPPPSEFTANKEVEFIRQVMLTDYKANKDFILGADDDLVALICALADDLGIGHFDDLYEELNEIAEQLAVPIMKLKWYYNRARPYQYAEKMGVKFPKFKTKTGNTPAYPSGHTIQAYFLASYLGEQSPQHRGILMDLAKDISFSRIQCGVHFPTDISYGVTIYRNLWSGIDPTINLEEVGPAFLKRKAFLENK